MPRYAARARTDIEQPAMAFGRHWSPGAVLCESDDLRRVEPFWMAAQPFIEVIDRETGNVVLPRPAVATSADRPVELAPVVPEPLTPAPTAPAAPPDPPSRPGLQKRRR